ncbi:hypothetical protein [Nocardioides convexus]|uniref:hypothetical protein n=1 Tax=Nocardioides convexus TaxID=2712224 RepID=UPI002418B0DF|nr:hypothetical protein [Nocardioides convexus]
MLGLRFNVWTSIVLFVAAAAFFVWSLKNRPGREESVYVDGRRPAPEGAGERTGEKTGEETAEKTGDEPSEDTAEDDPSTI